MEQNTLDFRALLVDAGAKPPRTERGRWGCPTCGKRRVGVDFNRQLFNCWTAGCEFHGNIVTLAKRLGLDTDSREWRKARTKAAQRLETVERAEALRRRVYQATAEKFRGMLGIYSRVSTGILEGGNQADLLENGLNLYVDLLALSAELLLLDVLPPLPLCDFIGAAEPTRQRQIMEVVSREGVWIAERFHELPPIVPANPATPVSGVPMSDESWKPTITLPPGHVHIPLSEAERIAQADAFDVSRKRAGR